MRIDDWYENEKAQAGDMIQYCPKNFEENEFVMVLSSLKLNHSFKKLDLNFQDVLDYESEDGIGVITPEAKQKIESFIQNFPEGEERDWIMYGIAHIITDIRKKHSIDSHSQLHRLVNPEHNRYTSNKIASQIGDLFDKVSGITDTPQDIGESGEVVTKVNKALEEEQEPTRIDIFVKQPPLGD